MGQSTSLWRRVSSYSKVCCCHRCLTLFFHSLWWFVFIQRIRIVSFLQQRTRTSQIWERDWSSWAAVCVCFIMKRNTHPIFQTHNGEENALAQSLSIKYSFVSRLYHINKYALGEMEREKENWLIIHNSAASYTTPYSLALSLTRSPLCVIIYKKGATAFVAGNLHISFGHLAQRL